MRLTEKIKAITQGSQPDGYGGSLPVDVVEFETWASIEQLRTSKDIEQAQLNLPATYRVKTRKEFFEHNLIEWRGKKYSILSTPQVDFVRRSRFYTFNMTEAVFNNNTAMAKITVENTLSKNLDLYKTKLFRDVVQLVEFAIKDTEMDAKRALNFDASYPIDTRFINIVSSFKNKGLTGEVAVEGAKREDGKGGNDMAAYIEFGTGLSAREILAPYPQWVKDIAMQFFVNGLGTLQGKPYLYNNFLKNVEKFKADLKALMDKQVTDK